MSKPKNNSTYHYDNNVDSKAPIDSIYEDVGFSISNALFTISDGDALKKKLNKSLKDHRHKTNVQLRNIVKEIAILETRLKMLEDDLNKYRKWDVVLGVLLCIMSLANLIQIFN